MPSEEIICNTTYMESYRELNVYQKSIDFVVKIYSITKSFPKTEIFALTDQINRAVVSIPSNIAEGFDRKSNKEYLQFLQIAYGSSAEVETQLIIASRLGYISKENFNNLDEELIVIRKMLHKLIIVLRSRD